MSIRGYQGWLSIKINAHDVRYALSIEPTLSGIHDMKRIIELAKNLSIPIQVIINKADINTKNSIAIEKLCKMSNIPVLGRLPFSDKVVESITKGVPVVEFCKEEITEEINIIWEKIAS
ncbi:MAG: nucleotide-binding protein [bacterium]